MPDGYPPDNIPIFSTSEDDEESRLEALEIGDFLLAKSFFDCREYDRCAAVFLPLNHSPINPSSVSPEPESQTPTKAAKGKGKARAQSPEAIPRPRTTSLPRMSQKSLFLALYAKYMAGEKRKDEDSEMIMGPMDTGATINKELIEIARRLQDWFQERTLQGKEAQNHGWLEYLYGVVLAKSNSNEDAKEYLIKSVHRNPFIWSAWIELRDLLTNVEAFRTIIPKLPQHLFAILFNVDANQSLYQTSPETHSTLTDLLKVFPTSQYLLTQRALLHYHSKDFEESESIFSSLIHTSPHRLDSLDHYSNVLYVMAARPKLAFLAQLATATDKFRPETCCIVGNYYSLKSEHEKAIMYFRRALTLDRTFLSAWTLMGHEYVEMKNTHAAIESYRRAVDINRKDYRAWYGLGQTYEVLEMHHYALFYFQRAAALRPYDKQMWQALAACYESIDRPLQAIKAYKRALIANIAYIEPSSSFGSASASVTTSSASNPTTNVFLDPELLYPIALLHEKQSEFETAASYMELVLAQEEGPASIHPDELPLGTMKTNEGGKRWRGTRNRCDGDDE
ncbi:Anaphase-promoting complex subunit 8, variant 2 [Xanthoria parietina]